MKTVLLFTTILAIAMFGGVLRADESECGDQCQEQLTAAREGTARYHNETEALLDGFRSTHHCLAAPVAALGAMGIHYPNLSRMRDTVIDPALPEILLYVPRADGGFRLVALEYFVPVISNGRPWTGGANEPPPVIDNPAPVLFGRRFDGPMPGHEPGQPWHYDLHVWAWRHNPAGLFNPFNPKVTCSPQASELVTPDITVPHQN